MELDIRTGTPANINAIRYADNRVIKMDGNDLSIQNNTGDVQLKVGAAKINDFIAALQAAVKLLG